MLPLNNGAFQRRGNPQRLLHQRELSAPALWDLVRRGSALFPKCLINLPIWSEGDLPSFSPLIPVYEWPPNQTNWYLPSSVLGNVSSTVSSASTSPDPDRNFVHSQTQRSVSSPLCSCCFAPTLFIKSTSRAQMRGCAFFHSSALFPHGCFFLFQYPYQRELFSSTKHYFPELPCVFQTSAS